MSGRYNAGGDRCLPRCRWIPTERPLIVTVHGETMSDAFVPLGTGAKCGFACHTIVVKKDYVFTAYPKR